MRCPSCGHDNLAGEDWCGECGTDLAHRDVPLPDDELGHLALTVTARQIATPAPVMVRPDDTIARALEQMRSENIRCVLVAEDDRLVGILTERDLVRHLTLGATGADRRVAELMTAGPVTVFPEDNLGTVLQRMNLTGARFLPVVEGTKAVGIISRRDVLHPLIPVLSAWPRQSDPGTASAGH